jgi:hypothetical protein
MTWVDWADFLRDLTAVGSITTVLVLGAKLIRPGHTHDRLAAIALGLATLASSAALFIGPFAGARFEDWALFCAPVLLLYWWLEAELGTRILGLAAGVATLPALFYVPRTQVIAVDELTRWPALAEAGGLVAGGMMAFAAANLILAFFYRKTGAMNARKTGRYFAINAETISEVIYRLVAWGLPFAIFAAIASLAGVMAGQLLWGVPLTWALSALLGGVYAWRCRRQGYEVGLRPWLLLSATATTMLGLGSLGILGSVF